MAINQISTANTFEGWLTATQSLISIANTLTDGRDSAFLANTNLTIDGHPNSAKLNVRTSGAINTLYANTANLANTEFVGSNITSLRVTTAATVGGDLQVYGNVAISGNISITTLNVSSIVANTALLTTANVTSLVGSANTALYSTINSADDRALAYSIIFS